MNFKIKTLLAAVATLGLMSAGITLPAHATGTPSITLVNSNDSLLGSTISGYDPATTIRLAIIANMGTVDWSDNGTGASLVSNHGSNAPAILLEGTQDQLNAAIGDVSIIKPCSGDYKLYAEVTDSQFVQDPVTGHLYKWLSTGDTFDGDKAQAEATPLVQGATNTFGYMATITNSLENVIVSNLASDNGYIGASDAAVEGDWKWVSGPEAGTLFYRGAANLGGHAVNSGYTNWGDNEPNNWGGQENYGQINGEGFWNDINGATGYTIEWGGMPGDDLSSAVFASDSIDIAAAGPFAGSGTQSDPYQVPDAAALRAVADCGYHTVYFKQTANISLPNDWAGDQNFEGHYDGNSKTIAFADDTVVHDQFGIWSTAGQNNTAFIHDLGVAGNLDAIGHSTIGLVIGRSSNVRIDHVNVSGTMHVGGGMATIGGVVGAIYGGTLDHINSTVNFNVDGSVYALGGIAGTMDDTIDHSTWDGAIVGSPGAELHLVAGLAGEGDCGSIYHSSASGTITGDSGYAIGGLGGNICGEISDSHASVDVNVPGAYQVGGLLGVGTCVGAFRDWATGDITGDTLVGGLIGANCGDTQDNFARGNVTANDNVGSLVGAAYDGNIERNYATGSVTTTGSTTRGWAGTLGGGLNKIHWVPSQSTIPVPSSLLAGEVPYTDADAKSFDYFNNDGWAIATQWNSESTWAICQGVNDGYPILNSGYDTDPCTPSLTNADAPTIVGAGNVGKALSVSKGNWDSGVAFGYQWKLDGNNIAGATAATYKPVISDIGKTVTVELTGSKQGFLTAVKLSSNSVVVTAAPAPVAPTEISMGEFAGDSWWIPLGFVAKVKAAVKAHSKATTVTCTGIVAPGNRKAWQKTLGLKRAALACEIAKSFNSKLKTKLDWRVSAVNAKVKRGAALKFNK